MSFPESVIACECWARDGLQSMPVVVSTAHKIEMIDRITAAGFKKVEVTSFSHPKLLPQFADAIDVLKGIRRRPGVSHVVLMPNEKGFDRLEACQKEGYGADEIILMISSSEKHNLLNFRMNHAEAMEEHARVMKRAHALGIRVIGCAGTVYGCPVGGDVPYRRGGEDRPLLPGAARRRSCSATPPASRTRCWCASGSAELHGDLPEGRVHRPLPRHARDGRA